MTKILLVDDHEVVRDGIKKIFDEQPETIVFGQAGTAVEALVLARAEDWDVVVLDLSLGARSGLEVLKELNQIRPRLPVLILSMHSEEQYARRAFKGGAAGYITKDSPRTELLKAIEKVIKGGRYLSPTLAETLVFDIERGTDRPPHAALSDREFEVMKLIASGRKVTEIAGILSLSDKTISTYRARILEKMNMKTNAEIIRYAIQNKLVD
jgi:DNA-binding NarL/FixJ family response regulator